MEQFPPWTFEEFERHTVTVAELVKGVGIRPPAQNGYWPKIIQAFRVNLTALTVDMLRDKNFVAFLQVGSSHSLARFLWVVCPVFLSN